MKKNLTISLTIPQSGRLDKMLALAAQDRPELALSRARLQHLIKDGRVALEEAIWRDANQQVQEGQVFTLTLPPPVQAVPKAESIALDILYEDEDLLVIDKPAGLVVHPAAGNWEGTLVNALLAHCGDSLSGVGGVARPGIVHRLDKDTSGLMVVAKNDLAHQALTRQFSDRSLSRTYRALVWGIPNPVSGDIEGDIGRHPRNRQKMAVVTRGGKEALTHYKVVETYGLLASLVECKLATGRTHQIRVHMAHIGHPVIGDPLYGTRRRAPKSAEKGLSALLEGFGRQALHAGEIGFIHPRTGQKMTLISKGVEDMDALTLALKKAKA